MGFICRTKLAYSASINKNLLSRTASYLPKSSISSFTKWLRNLDELLPHWRLTTKHSQKAQLRDIPTNLLLIPFTESLMLDVQQNIRAMPLYSVYSKTYLNRPTTGPILYGPFREMVGFGS